MLEGLKVKMIESEFHKRISQRKEESDWLASLWQKRETKSSN